MKQLKFTNEVKRQEAAWKLCNSQHSYCTEALFETMLDGIDESHTNMSTESTMRLIDLGVVNLTRLVDSLNSNNYWVRTQSCNAVLAIISDTYGGNRYGYESNTDYIKRWKLIGYKVDTSTYARKKAISKIVDWIGEMNYHEIGDSLMKRSKNISACNKLEVASELIRIGHPAALEVCLSILGVCEGEQLIANIINIGHEALKPMVDSMSSSNSLTRKNSQSAFEGILKEVFRDSNQGWEQQYKETGYHWSLEGKNQKKSIRKIRDWMLREELIAN